MSRTILTAAVALAAINLAAAANAQVSFSFGGSKGSASVTIGGGPRFSGGHTVHRPAVGYPGGGWSRPSTPVHVGPSQVIGYNPWTGAVHTHNNQVNDTAFDYGRNSSQFNGTKRYVNRPVRDAWGNVVGYERGYVWNNSFTGQEHGDTTVVRPNGTGGTDSTNVVRSVAPPSTGGTSSTSVRSFRTGTNSTSVSYAPVHP